MPAATSGAAAILLLAPDPFVFDFAEMYPRFWICIRVGMPEWSTRFLFIPTLRDEPTERRAELHCMQVLASDAKEKLKKQKQKFEATITATPVCGHFFVTFHVTCQDIQ
jgi:hypothetical protein